MKLRHTSLILMLLIIGAVSSQALSSDKGTLPTSVRVHEDTDPRNDDDKNDTKTDTEPKTEDTKTETKTESEDKKDNSDTKDEDDKDHDGVDDKKEEAFSRKIEVNAEPYQFEAKSTLKTGSVKDTFKVSIKTDSNDPAEIKFKFETEAELNGTSNSTELSYKVKFDKIIEFVDTGAAGYQNETIVSTYRIGDAGWNELAVNYDQTLELLVVNVTSIDGVFALTITMAGSFLNKDNVTISPNSVKIDVLINNYPLVQNDTKLALQTKIKTESEMKMENESEEEKEGIAKNETQLKINSAVAAGYFSWADYADVDGKTVSVIPSSITDASDEEGEKSSKVFFTFNATNPQNIYWDPRLGVISDAALANLASILNSVTQAGALPIPWIMVLASLLVIPALRRRKKLA